jgi:hypothetical protein
LRVCTGDLSVQLIHMHVSTRCACAWEQLTACPLHPTPPHSAITHQSLSRVTPVQICSLGVPSRRKMCSSCSSSQSPGNRGCCGTTTTTQCAMCGLFGGSGGAIEGTGHTYAARKQRSAQTWTFRCCAARQLEAGCSRSSSTLLTRPALTHPHMVPCGPSPRRCSPRSTCPRAWSSEWSPAAPPARGTTASQSAAAHTHAHKTAT